MILRLGANAAAHAAGGFVLGVTGALAVCTAAQAANHALKHGPRPSRLAGRFEDAMPEGSPVAGRTPAPDT